MIVSRTGQGPGRFLASIRPDDAVAGAAAALQALLEAAEDAAQIGSWEWNLETDELSWSDNLFRIYGLEPGEVDPSLGYGYLFDQIHPGDRELVTEAGDSIRLEGQLEPLEYRFIRPDGGIRHLRATQALVEHSAARPRRILGTVQDITERRRAEREIATHIAISEALVNWRTLEQGSEEVLRGVTEVLECSAGAMWIPQGDILVARVVRSGEGEVAALIESVIRQLRLPRGIGLAGRAWESREPIAIGSLADDPRFPHGSVDGVNGAVALPAIYAKEVLAVLEFFLCEPADGSERFMRSLAGIGHELGRFLAHRGGELKPSSTLTPREVEVLQLAANGHSGNEIAEQLVVTPATVKTHFERIYLKYGASNRASAVAKALREGLIE